MGLRNFKKGTDPCPICNNDWCAKLPDDDGGEFGILEKRNLPPEGTKPFKYVVRGLNGREYIFTGFSKEGYAVFRDREASDRAWELKKAQEKDRWMREKGVGPYKGQQARKMRTPSAESGIVTVDASPKSAERQPLVPQNEPLPPERLHSIYSFMMSRLYLDDWHRAKYASDGWSPSLLLSVRSSPKGDLPWRNGKPEGSKNPTCTELAKMVTDRYGKDILRGVPGAYLTKQGEWTFYFPSGVVFPMYDKDGFIHRLRIRMDYMDVAPNKDITWSGRSGEFTRDGERFAVSMKGFSDMQGNRVDGSRFGAAYAGKYRTLQSGGMNEGTPSRNEYSLYRQPGDDSFLCYIVEGEPKSMFSNHKLKSPVISISGVSSWSCLFQESRYGESLMDRLRKDGTEEFVVAYDADSAVNEMVQREKEKLEKALMEHGFLAAEADWSREYAKDPSLKGLDDLLAAGKKLRLRFISSGVNYPAL